MLSRTDGSEMQTIYQSDTSSGVQPEWSPDSRQIAFTDNGPLGIVTLKIDEVTAGAQPCSSNQIANRVKSPGKFPVAPAKPLLVGTR
jgi:Tol biopolymer transport system component